MNHKDRLLSTILILNNVCNIGATLSFLMVYNIIDQHVFLDLAQIPSPESWFLTPCLVLFGEILPKSLFRIYPFRLTLKAIPALMICYFFTLPFTWLFSKFVDLFRKEPPGFEESFKAKVREEMVLVALEGSKRGTLMESADILINNVLQLKDKTIKDIITGISEFKKRQQVFTSNQALSSVIKKIPNSDEILVFDEQATNPVGTVSIIDIAIEGNKKRFLSELMKPVRKIEVGQSLLSMLQSIQPDSTEFYLAMDNEKAVGIVAKSRLYQQIFGSIDSALYQKKT